MNEPLKPISGVPSALELELKVQVEKLEETIKSLNGQIREKDEVIAGLEMKMLEFESKSVSFNVNTTSVVTKGGFNAGDI